MTENTSNSYLPISPTHSCCVSSPQTQRPQVLQLQRSDALAELGDTRKPTRPSICCCLRMAFFSLFRFAVFSHWVIFAISLLAVEHEHHQQWKRYVLVAFEAVPQYSTRVEAHRNSARPQSTQPSLRVGTSLEAGCRGSVLPRPCLP